MSKLAVALTIISLLFGGMVGYSLAYSWIYQDLKAQRQVAPPAPVEKKAPPLPTGTSPFAQVIEQASGQRVLPLDSVCEPVLDAIAQAADSTMQKLNEPTSPLIGLRRINEASRFFEDSLLELLDSHPDLRCQIPLTQEGNAQRSGYPDLMLTHEPTGRVYYLDPKLYEASSQESSLRTFYFTPRSKTSKILKNGHHLLIGFAHDGKDGQWQFESWRLVDLSQISLTLKSEYNASNKELYQEGQVVRKSP
ncbi:hypothetical protein AAFN60_10835 [Roseibacillus persicicus]|uniref:hypothetical protein n=1 Tax=Roseibacillus persicicus TaxID=454148 RepID=UPI00398A8F64